jgi:ribosomal protein S18 acetylase RimI-like enzyme
MSEGAGQRPAIRRALAADAAKLARTKRDCFRQTFLGGYLDVPYSAENLAVFEAEAYSKEAVAAELADPARAQWVAEVPDGHIVAYVHVGPCKLPHADVRVDHGEIYQLYVLDQWQGHGLGRRLMEIAFTWLAEHRPGPVWLGVYSENLRAQAIYARYGFARAGDYEFKVGEHRDHEFIFRRD